MRSSTWAMACVCAASTSCGTAARSMSSRPYWILVRLRALAGLPVPDGGRDTAPGRPARMPVKTSVASVGDGTAAISCALSVTSTGT